MLGGLIGEGEFRVNFGTSGNWLGSSNLRDIFNAAYPGITGPVRVVFTQFGNVGATNRSWALRTGTWDAGSEIVLNVPTTAGQTEGATNGLILGAGWGANRNQGCAALILDYNLTLVNDGIIGGGGGNGADRGGPDGNGGGGAGYPSGGPSEGSGPGSLFSGGGGSGGSGFGAGLGKLGGCASYCPGSYSPAIYTNGWTYTFDAASANPWFAGNLGERSPNCNPLANAGDRNGGVS
jgi:hypothetical protein